MTKLTDEAVKALLDGATPGPWRADGEPWNRVVWSPNGNRVCFMAHSSGLDDARDTATSNLVAAAPDLARALLDARAELARVRAERDYFAAENASLKAREEGVAMALKAYRATFCHASPGSDTEFALFLEGFDAAADIARAALAPTPTDPGDGWTWNERLGWIGPDGKPADPRRRG